MSVTRFEPAPGPVVVLHLQEFVTTFEPIARERLAAFPGVRRFDLDESRAAALRRLLTSDGADLEPWPAESIDVRWEIRFGEGEGTGSACWLDRTGRLFATAERVFTLATEATTRWLRAEFGPDDVVPSAGMPAPGPPPPPLP